MRKIQNVILKQIIALIVVISCSSTSMAQENEDTSRLNSVMEAAGCMWADSNDEAIRSVMSLTEDEADLLLSSLVASGDAVMVSDTFIFRTGACVDGTNPVRAYLYEAALWSHRRNAAEAAYLVEDAFSALGCAYMDDHDELLEERLVRNIATLHDITLPSTVSTLSVADYGVFLRAINAMLRRGAEELVNAGRIDTSQTGVIRLLDCSPFSNIQ